MKDGIFYACKSKSGNYISLNRLLQVIFCGLLLTASSAAFAKSLANDPPSFIAGTTQSMAVCQNSSAADISSRLAITDADAGQLEIWSVASGPAHGTLGGFDASDTSTGGTVTPAGLTYTPATGYSGTDTFTIMVTDGFDVAFTTFTVTVRMLPNMISSLNPPAICDGSVFSYAPMSGSTGATFAWHRAYVPGISNPTANGLGNPNEVLSNTTYYDITVLYVYTVTANGCSSTHTVNEVVKPTPRLSSKLYDTTCSGGVYNYAPVSATPGTTYTWSRSAVADISPATSAGAGNISEALTNSNTASSVNTVYTFSLNANGCTSTRNLTVTVIPALPVTSITTASEPDVCAGSVYRNFGAGIAPPAGVSYTWSAVNADIWAVGNTGQYALVNFLNSGDAAVALTINVGSSHCVINDTFFLNVGGGVSPAADVLYYNYQLIYTDNTQGTYQWGYDKAGTLEPVVIPGAMFQSYPVSSPDFTDNYYWVLTTKVGCTQKTYYNRPVAVTNVNTSKAATLKLYPNPAADVVNVEVSGIQSASTSVTITDVTGHSIMTETFNGQTAQLNVANLPAGCYFITCSQNDMKIATGKFIKE